LVDAEDLVRRALLKVDLDATRKQVNLRYVLPGDNYLTERQFDPRTGEIYLNFRVDLGEMAKRYLPASEPRKEGGAGPAPEKPGGQPEPAPAAPSAPATPPPEAGGAK
jgi:hypothetical protein